MNTPTTQQALIDAAAKDNTTAELIKLYFEYLKQKENEQGNKI